MKLFAAVLLLFGVTNAQDCDPGWVRRGNTNFCYQFVETPQTFDDALGDCISKSGFVTHILDQEEQDFTAALIKNQTSDVWLGLTDTDNGKGVWDWTGYICVADTYWDEGQPSYGNGDANCAVMKANTSLWDDRSCSELYPFICKKKIGGTYTYSIPLNLTCSNNCMNNFPNRSCVLYDNRVKPCEYQIKIFDRVINGVDTYYVLCTTDFTVPTTTRRPTTTATTTTTTTTTSAPTTSETTTLRPTTPARRTKKKCRRHRRR